MDRLRGVNALLFVEDPDKPGGKPGVRYEVTRQVCWSYPLFARCKTKQLTFVAEGEDAELAMERLVALLSTSANVLLATGDFDPWAWSGPAQIPHPTESVPSWPGFWGISRSLLEWNRRMTLAGWLPSMTNREPDALGARLLEEAREQWSEIGT